MRTPNAKRLGAVQGSPGETARGGGARRLRTAGRQLSWPPVRVGEQKREGPGAMENLYKAILQTSITPRTPGGAAATDLLTEADNGAPPHLVQSAAEPPASSE